MRFSLLLLLALAAAARPAPARLLINEVLYDPAGTDDGREFVELYNPDDEPAPLGGIELWFINGADPRPRTAWRMEGSSSLAPRAFFVVGGREVEADVTIDLGLQNGPDGLWLVRAGETLDAVAWGDLDLGEGQPAPDVGGTSLGRVPDGADSDDNQEDFEPLEKPSPGRVNAVESRLLPTTHRVAPEWRPDAGSSRVTVELVATGSLAMQEGPLLWVLDGEVVAEDWLRSARGDTVQAEIEVDLGLGPHDLLAVTPSLEPDTLRVPLQVGLAQVVLNEVMARPSPGEPEWIELRAIGPGAVDLAHWALSDASRIPRPLAETTVLRPGQLAVASQDPAGLRQQYAVAPEVLCTALEGGWATLNNPSTSSVEPADEVLLYDDRGAVVDLLAYDASLSPETGTAMERGLPVPGAPPLWFVSPGRPSPGGENVTAGAPLPAVGLEIGPNPFTPDGDGVDDVLHVVLRDAQALGLAEAEIRHLAGERVTSLGIRPASGTLRQWIWDGRDAAGRAVPVGAYLVVVRAADSEGPREKASWRSLVALGRRR